MVQEIRDHGLGLSYAARSMEDIGRLYPGAFQAGSVPPSMQAAPTAAKSPYPASPGLTAVKVPLSMQRAEVNQAQQGYADASMGAPNAPKSEVSQLDEMIDHHWVMVAGARDMIRQTALLGLRVQALADRAQGEMGPAGAGERLSSDGQASPNPAPNAPVAYRLAYVLSEHFDALQVHRTMLGAIEAHVARLERFIGVGSAGQ